MGKMCINFIVAVRMESVHTREKVMVKNRFVFKWQTAFMVNCCNFFCLRRYLNYKWHVWHLFEFLYVVAECVLNMVRRFSFDRIFKMRRRARAWFPAIVAACACEEEDEEHRENLRNSMNSMWCCEPKMNSTIALFEWMRTTLMCL